MVEQVNPRLLKSEPMRRCKLGECQAACCLYGVWIDTLEAQRIVDHAAEIIPHLPPAQQDPAAWFDDREDVDEFTPSGKVLHSAVIESNWHYGGTACVFLRPDYKCALQVAADHHGWPAWEIKPFYCILHPLDLDDQGRITLDDTGLLLDEPGSCLRPSATPIPLVDTFEPELRHFLGDQGYSELRRQAGLD